MHYAFKEKIRAHQRRPRHSRRLQLDPRDAPSFQIHHTCGSVTPSHHTAIVAFYRLIQRHYTNKLATPTGVKTVNIGTSENPVVQILWNSVPNATIYRVIKTYPKNGGYEIDGQNCSTGVLADTGNEYTTDNQVEVGTAYEYQVMAAGSGYESSNWSAIARINL